MNTMMYNTARRVMIRRTHRHFFVAAAASTDGRSSSNFTRHHNGTCHHQQQSWFSAVVTDEPDDIDLPDDGTTSTTTTSTDSTAATTTTSTSISKNELQRNLRPSEIVQQLDQYVVGQKDAKRAVAIALRNRWRRRLLPEDLRKEIMPKNVLLVGPTGMFFVVFV